MKHSEQVTHKGNIGVGIVRRSQCASITGIGGIPSPLIEPKALINKRAGVAIIESLVSKTNHEIGQPQ